jgi:transposase-like protein
MSPIEAAIEAIESLRSGEKFSYTKVASQFGVDRSTLSRRHKATQVSHTAKSINQRKLSTEQERALVRYIQGLSERHLPPTRDIVQNFASQIAKEPISKSWVSRFLGRHKIDLILHWVTSIDRDRHNADSEAKYRLYFDLF